MLSQPYLIAPQYTIFPFLLPQADEESEVWKAK